MEENNMIEEKNLELRMYFFTIYQLSGIQKGIQCGHAALEYAAKYWDDTEYLDFIKNWKTWVILNGGTTNDERDFDGISSGTLNKIGDDLFDKDIKFSFFREPDLNNSLTAICFILDERVFNRKDYPDFINYLDIEYDYDYKLLGTFDNEGLIEEYPTEYKEWVRLIGGLKNVFLRELIKEKKLA